MYLKSQTDFDADGSEMSTSDTGEEAAEAGAGNNTTVEEK